MKILSTIFVYCPQNGMNEEDKDEFYNEISTEAMARNGKWVIIILMNFKERDFNGHVGSLMNEAI